MTHANPASYDPSPEDYRSLSPLAALALLLGLLSPAALIAPILLVVPAAAVGVGVLALGKIRSSDGALTGAGAARWGIAIALACTAATLVRGPVRDMLLRRQMTAAAAHWLDLLANQRFEDATTLMGNGALRSLGPPAPTPGSEPPTAEESHAVVLNNLENDKLTKRLADLKPPLRITAEPAGGEDLTFDGPVIYLLSHFLVRPADGDQSLRAEVRMMRSGFYEADGRPWRVESWNVVE